MSALALLTSLYFGFFSYADFPPDDLTQQWLCKLEARLTGDPILFMQNNLDSWSGNTTLICSTPTLTFSKPVTVQFNGQTYYGNNVNASIHIKIDVTTAVSPSFFVLSAAARTQVVGDQIHWEIAETYNNVIHATGWRDEASIGECESLKKGQLLILDAR